MKYEHIISVAITADMLDKISEQKKRIENSNPGFHVTFSEVLRMNLLKGMACNE